MNWAILGAGTIAEQMGNAMNALGKPICGVASRTLIKAQRYAQHYGVQKVYMQPDDIFSDPDVDIVYIATPHTTHYVYTKKALEAGKHVLVEKSITLNSMQLDDLRAIASSKKLILAEADTVWHMPLYQTLMENIVSGNFGRVNLINVNFGSFKNYDMQNRFFNPELGGGAMLDIGIYALSVIRTFMQIKTDHVMGVSKFSPAGTDENDLVLLTNEQDQMASMMLSLHSRQPKRAMISCEKGYIEIMDYPRADRAIFTDALTGQQETVSAGESARALQYEVLHMEQAVQEHDEELMRIRETADVMAAMTKLRMDWNLKYPEEKW